MDVSKLVFRGNINAPGEWYGKIEKEDGKKALVLFKRPEERNKTQHMADKFNDVHKGAKLASEFIENKKITLIGKLNEKELLQKYLQSAHQTDTTLNVIANLLTNQTPSPNGGVKFLAQVSPVTGGGIPKDISISWQPDDAQ